MALKRPVKARRSRETKGLGMPMGRGLLLASERGKVLSSQSGSFQLRALNPKAWRRFRLSQLGERDELLLASVRRGRDRVNILERPGQVP